MSTRNHATTGGSISRRDILKVLGLGGLAAAITAALRQAPFISRTLAPSPPGDRAGSQRQHEERVHHWGMVIDLTRCIGCDYCVQACQATNDVADDMRWNVRVVDRTAAGNLFHLTRNCLHCQEAPCVTVCPVGATYNREEDGLVVMDYDLCIGCRYCQVACPYEARRFNWKDRQPGDNSALALDIWGEPEIERRERGVMEKCTFCVHRIDAGLERGLTPGVDRSATPACVNACPVGARFFGDLNDPDSPVSQVIANNTTIRLREELGTETSVYYIPQVEVEEGSQA